jgi:D-3-phosphoglycerate dehydrogenase
LKIIGTTSVGLDHVANEFLEDSAMTVINTPLANVISVAEFSVGAILALVKRTLPAAAAGLSGSGRPGVGGKTHDINGMTLGIIGAGRIGTRLASLADALGMDVVVWTRDPSRHPEVAGQFVDLDKLLSKSDVISVNLPLTPDTSGLLTAERIRSLASNQYLVNTSRFAIMDERATVEIVANQAIAGIAIDGEIPDSVRLSVPEGFNAILTPHIAGISSEALGRMDMELVDALLPVLGSESENR